MNFSRRERFLNAGLTLAAGIAIYGSYKTYVPLVRPFQIILVPVLQFCFALTDARQDIIVLFEVSRTWNPLQTFGTPDPRNLGVAIGRIEFL